MNSQLQSVTSLATADAFMRHESAAMGRVELPRKEWVRRCAARLGDLRPEHDWALITALAKSMWPDVRGFDPRIAAELEHESWL